MPGRLKCFLLGFPEGDKLSCVWLNTFDFG
jgi:hypothetical protein